MTDQTTTIPKGWKITTLGNQLKVGRGSSPRPIQDYLSDHGIPWVKIADASASQTRYIVKTKQCIKEEGRSTSVKIGDLIVSNSATPGIPKLMGIDACVHDGWLVFSDYVDLDKLYLYYFFLDYRRTLAQSASGTVFVNLQTDIVRNIELSLPPLPEQRAIAAVLSTLDDKIELLREQNKTFEATAQAIFKEWFVNFNFPGSTGKMIDSEFGEIPEGWRVNKLGNEIKIVYGKNLPTESLTKSGYTVFGANGQIGFHNKFIYEKPQVLVSCRGEASGKVNISLPESFVTNNSLVLEIADDSDLNFCFLKFFSLNNDYTNFVTGSAQPQITIDSLKNCDLLLPPKKIMDFFNVTVEPMDKKQLSNFYQIQTLSTFRDTLLPKLIKGEVRVEGFN